MSRNTPVPFFTIPPRDYEQQYFMRMVQDFSVYLRRMQNAGEGRNTQLVLTALQTDDSGLENGGLFQQDGFVKIALAYKPHVRGSSATGTVGAVTVSTP
jgi:hypothetical protein